MHSSRKHAYPVCSVVRQFTINVQSCSNERNDSRDVTANFSIFPKYAESFRFRSYTIFNNGDKNNAIGHKPLKGKGS